MYRKILLTLASVITMGGLAAPAQAAFQLRLEFGGATILFDRTTSTTTYSGGAVATGTVDYSVAGEITLVNVVVSTSGTTGGFKITATAATSNSPGANNVATIDLGALLIRNQTGIAGNSTLSLDLTDTGFTQPVGDEVIATSTISATAAGTNLANASITFNSFLDTGNGEFGTQQEVGEANLTVTPGNSQSSNLSKTLDGSPSPYSLSQFLDVTLANGERLADGSSGTTVYTPAPAGLLLALSAMPILGVFYRRRRSSPTPVIN